MNISVKARESNLVPFAPEQVLICEYGFVGPAATGKARFVSSAGLLEPLVATLAEATNRLAKFGRSPRSGADGNDCAAPPRSGLLDFESGTQVIDLRFVTGCDAVVTNGVRTARASTQWLSDLHRYISSIGYTSGMDSR